MSRSAALVRMRLLAYVKSQRAVVPMIAALALVFFAHAGGAAGPGPAYGFAAVLLFGVFAWQAKLLLDSEPDEQRRLARLSVGSMPAELFAGMAAAFVAALPLVAVSLVVPFLTRTLELTGGPWLALLVGGWLHLLAVLGGLATGALVSRAIVPSAGWSAVILVGSTVLVLILGSRDALGLQWLVPQLFAGIRAVEDESTVRGLVVTLHAMVWSALVLAAYAILRRGRA